MNNKPKGVIRLTGQQVSGEEVSCTGAQLVKLLQVLKVSGDNFHWFAADISTNDNFIPSFLINGYQPFYVGTTEKLIQASSQINQYFSGIFLAVSQKVKAPIWGVRSFETEDEPTDALGDAILEIRAFDTTYFEIYSSDLSVLKLLCDCFGSVINQT